VSDILDFARLEAGKLSFNSEPFDLDALLKQIVQSLMYQVREKGLLLHYEFAVDAPKSVLGDHNRVRQVIVNLLSNAIKFTDHGSIFLSVSSKESAPTYAIFDVVVKDTGIGVREEKLGKLFQRFSQVDSIYHRKHRGIGLGLAITKQLVEAMGGHIAVKSEYGKGSEFHFTLTLQRQMEIATVTYSSSNAVEHPKSHFLAEPRYQLKVLLVEDNLINQKIAKIILEDFHCKVDIANNGEDVLSRLSDMSTYDIVFMDVGLPDLSGFEIASCLRQQPDLASLPIVAMTAHILDRDKQQAYASGMNRVIAKPISYEEIGAVLEEYSQCKHKNVA
jgi:CheY-like chemotaxis protein